MISEVDFSKSFGFWWEDSKWSGVFQIKWIFIKDVEYEHFADVLE